MCWPATFTLSIWSQRKRPWNPPEKLEFHLKCWRRNRSLFAGSAHDHRATSHDPFWITPTHWHTVVTVVHRISRFWNYYVVTSTKIEKQFLIITILVGISRTTSFSSFLGAITCGDSCSKKALQCQPQEASNHPPNHQKWLCIHQTWGVYDT